MGKQAQGKGREILLKYERQPDGILWKELKLIENEKFVDLENSPGLVSIFKKEGGHGQPHIKFHSEFECELEGLRQLIAWSEKGARPRVVKVEYVDDVKGYSNGGIV